MKSFLIGIVLLCSVGGSDTINQIRKMYPYAVDSEENTKKFYEFTQNTNYRTNDLLAAYHGCALVLMASIESNFFDKISYFRRGRKVIDQAALSDPDNIEIRMIRLSVQMNVPMILGYRKNIEEDKEFIISGVDEITNPELKIMVKGFMKASDIFTDSP